MGQLTCYGGLGLVFFLARIRDVVTDVGVGFASDRTHARWGRCRPWNVAGAPPLLRLAH